jgi:Zn-dependent metalloprotease
MAEPGTAYDDPRLGKDPQPATMSDYVHIGDDNGGVHVNSGIPNRAFYLVATKLGGFAWEKAGKIWYNTIRDRSLRNTATFRQFAHRTEINASHLFGSSSPERKAVTEAWEEVGIKI